MPVENGTGRSEANTSVKQEQFRIIIATLLRIVDSIGRRMLGAHCFYYWDLTAGPGELDDGSIGSPLIFLKEAKRLGVPYKAFLFECRHDTFDSLERAVSTYQNVQCFQGPYQDNLEKTVDSRIRHHRGVVYIDPNGEIPDTRSIIDLLSKTYYQRVDLLMQVTATGIKRGRMNNPEKPSLRAIMNSMPKKHWLLRRRRRDRGWQWLFLLGTNWDRMQDSPWEKHGFISANSEEGRYELDQYDLTQNEWECLRANPEGYQTYQEYLKHPKFLAVRVEVMQRANWVCEVCKSRKATEPHHLKYPKWGTFDKPDNLLAVCHECHCELHGKES